MRKTRSDSILLSLPEDTKRAIFRLEAEEDLGIEGLRQRLGMPEAEGGFGIKCSYGTVQNFLSEMRVEIQRERLLAATKAAADLDGVMDEEQSRQIDQGIVAGLKEWIFDSMLTRDMAPKDAKALFGLVLKHHAQSLDERKVALLEQKAADYDRLKAATEPQEGEDLTEDEIRDRTLSAVDEILLNKRSAK